MMKASEITSYELKCVAENSDDEMMQALAQPELDRRAAGKVEVVKSLGVSVAGLCDICGDWVSKCGHAIQPKPTERAEIESLPLLLLKLRNAIADKEFATAHANRQLDMGGWTQDWQHEQGINDTIIAELISKIEAVENEMRKR